ncbi:zinc-dependent alcohol dehydrogenase [Roseobacter sp. CCS2]|uniref:zinc-dependent alcohol dehydrogenase n=1 Tax=Roseobacter sp. CCS2 TaxID=391593 RepID=UPI0000F3E044|nr:zinc-binding alcohol dehydrogenase [Roseobacter sp. CCS2]EBA11978.1 putative dehydrogenase [Roseobacter sp. CCS2]
MTIARALWITGAQQAASCDTSYHAGEGDVEVKTLFTGISRGTERLVYQGHVPASEHASMRAPFQEGDFTFPVKYGYAAIGEVQNGARRGEVVFSLFPHQTSFAVPAHMALTLPAHVPAARAVLAANMETAVNIMWDAGVSVGDRVVVVGCGVVGALVGYLAARVPGTEVTLVDIDPGRAALAATLGCGFSRPDTAPKDADVVIHAAASAAGLALAIAVAGIEATVVEASWYGAQSTEVPLGGRFHQRRLRIISSQVGRIPAGHAARWDYGRRLAKALTLLNDPALDTLISGETTFGDLPGVYDRILRDPATLCHRVRYDD